MTLRLALVLAWVLAFPTLAMAQAPAAAVHAPVRPVAPVKPVAPAVTAAPVKTPSATATSVGPFLIDVNSADEKTLDTLPGIGAARAKAIVANRPYSDKQDLVTKKAVPASVFAGLEDKIALVNINKTPAADMAKILPNVGPVRAQQIVDKRPYAVPQDLVAKGALSQGIFDGIRGLITAGP